MFDPSKALIKYVTGVYSQFAAGIVRVEGDFQQQSLVAICDAATGAR